MPNPGQEIMVEIDLSAALDWPDLFAASNARPAGFSNSRVRPHLCKTCKFILTYDAGLFDTIGNSGNLLMHSHNSICPQTFKSNR